MSQPDEPTIERITDLNLSVDELWSLISTTEGWRSWLVDDADLVIAPDSTGVARDAGAERYVRIDSITEGRGIDFSWWIQDDPSSASHVRLDIVELPNGRSRLHVAERFLGATSGATMSCSVAETTSVTWDVRFVSLWLLALHTTVMA